MNRNQREAARKAAEANRQARAFAVRAAAERTEHRDKLVREALVRPTLSDEARIVDEVLSYPNEVTYKTAPAAQRGHTQRIDQHALFARARGYVSDPERDVGFRQLRALIKTVGEEAPRLIAADFGGALLWLSTIPWVRPIESWKPRGKGRDSVFRSLVEHLIAKFPLPVFLISAFFSDVNASKLVPLVGHLGAGGSLFEAVKTGLLPVPLTRRMCHDLLKTPSDVTIMTALRRVSVESQGGDPRLVNVWMATDIGRTLQPADAEAFWMTVIAWFAANPMLDPSRIGPLVDYIVYRRREDAKFSMKGRTPLAMMRGMDEWHGQLAKAKAVHGTSYKPSGFKAGKFERQVRLQDGNSITVIWRIEEILTSKALAEEGRKLAHCVYSYGHSIDSGRTSIWSLTTESFDGGERERHITIEVRNDLHRIVQARGRFNRMPTSQEFTIMTAWAGQNNLDVSLGRW